MKRQSKVWYPVAMATIERQVAECGHPSPGREVRLRPSPPDGGPLRVTSVCAACAEGTDYLWRPGSGRPVRLGPRP